MLLSNIKGALRQIRQDSEQGYDRGYIGRHRAPEERAEAEATMLPVIPGALPVPAPRPAPAR